MHMPIDEYGSIVLLLVFVVHLAAFAWLAIQRRQGYYIALVVTFALLIAAIGVRLTVPNLVLGELPLHSALRYLAWAAAAVSVTWTANRLLVRVRGRQPGRQNCS